MRVRADECKKLVNKGFSGKWTARAKPSKAIEKPTETGVTLLSRYYVLNSKDGLGRISKCWYTSSIRLVPAANIPEFPV